MLLSLATLTAALAARAVELSLAGVYPNDTFSIDITGYNQANPGQYINLIPSVSMATFGTTTTYAGAASGGQNLTVSSVEYIANGQHNDYFTVSVPTNLVPSRTADKGGKPLDALSFSIGNFPGGTNTLDFNTALTDHQTMGSLAFINQGAVASQAVVMTTVLTNGNTSFSTIGSVTAVNDISNNQVSEVGILVTYAVPKPSTYAAVPLGTFGPLLVVRRCRRARA